MGVARQEMPAPSHSHSAKLLQYRVLVLCCGCPIKIYFDCVGFLWSLVVFYSNYDLTRNNVVTVLIGSFSEAWSMEWRLG